MPDDWRFVGQSAANGATVTDEFTDLEIEGAGRLPIDHYAGVPTVNAAGATILGQPLPVYFGPIGGRIVGLGDPYRPGHIYWSLVDAPGHFPADGRYEVCPASEQLMTGGVYGGQGFCFSRRQLYLLYQTETGFTTTSSGCHYWTPSRQGVAITPRGIAFINPKGILLTAGGPPESL